MAGKLYFNTDTLSIYNDDVITTKCVSNKSIDLVITSPPYNVDIQYNTHDDEMIYEDYLSFTKQWIAKCYKLVKSDGRFCLNIPLDKNKGGQQSVCADITTIAKQVGFKYHSTIIWNEQNISRRTAWGSWLSASAPYVIAPVEVILVLYKEQWKKVSGSRQSDISREEFLEWTNGVWNFSGESKRKIGHPAPFPVELPRRCIKLFSFVGDTILDPFLGSGSTLVACLQTNRKGIGIETDKNYCAIAEKRLKDQKITAKKRNKYDKKDSLEIGEKAEHIFVRTALEKGWKVEKASKDSNINEHWDFLMENKSKKYKVDVKAMKRMSRDDSKVQDAWLWVELHGVRNNDHGWLYDGKAELIAIEKEKSFIIVKRNELVKLVEQLVDMDCKASSSKDAKYKVYSRSGRPDKITMIETEKLKAVKWVEWKKL